MAIQRKPKSWSTQVWAGVKTAWGILQIMAWVFLVVAGTGWTRHGSDSLFMGLAALCIAGTWMVLTMDRWVKILPGILGYGAIMGVVMLWAGHPAESRGSLFLVVFFMAVCCVLSWKISSRRLTLFDRVAVIGFAVSVVCSVVFPESVLFFSSLMCILMLLVWIKGFIREKRAKTSVSTDLSGS